MRDLHWHIRLYTHARNAEARKRRPDTERLAWFDRTIAALEAAVAARVRAS